jgi:hypothetical protein
MLPYTDIRETVGVLGTNILVPVMLRALHLMY